LVLSILVARYLGPEKFGLMNYVISYAFLFQILASFGIDSIEVREEAAGKVPYTTIIGTAFWLKLVFGIICIGLSVGTAVVMQQDTETIGLIAIYSCYIVFNAFIVIRNYFTSLVQNRYIVLSEIFRTFVGIAIKLVLLFLQCDLVWFVVAFMFDWALLASGYITAYRNKIGSLRDWQFSLPYARYLIKESFPLLVTNAAVIIYQRIDQVMIGDMVSKESVGYFSVAAKFVEVMIFIPTTLTHTISPVLVKLFNENIESYKQKAQQFTNITVWLCILCSIIVSLIAYWLIMYTFGEKYIFAVAILQILSFKMCSAAISACGGTMVIVEKLQKWVFFRDVLGCIVCVVLNYILLPRYGAIAAAIVAILANLTAGYISDALIPSYHHIFARQTKAILLGWRDLIHIKQLLNS